MATKPAVPRPQGGVPAIATAAAAGVAGEAAPSSVDTTHIIGVFNQLKVVLDSNGTKEEVLRLLYDLKGEVTALTEELSAHASRHDQLVKGIKDKHAKETKILSTQIGKLEALLLEATQKNTMLESENESLRQQVEDLETNLEILRKELRKQKKETEVNLEKKASEVREQLRAEFALKLEDVARGEQQRRMLQGAPPAEALEAGQVAFDFMNLARDIVLGVRHPPESWNEFASLDDLDAYTHDVNPDKRGNYTRLMEALQKPRADAFVMRSLKKERVGPAHPSYTASWPIDKIREVLSTRVDDMTADAFVTDLHSLRKLHATLPK